MKVLNYLPPKQRRLGVLLSLAAICVGWSIILPPSERLEPVTLELNHKKPLDSSGQNIDTLEISPSNFFSWDLPIIEQNQEKSPPIVKDVKPSKIMVKKKIPVPVQPVPIIPYEIPKPVVNLPQVKYLGQVVDASGIQVFLIIDDFSVVMVPQKVYQQTWKIISINDYEVRLMHLPTQQIMRVTKS
ncbi:hypothetical protein BFR75_02545 [Acinetobacter pittii]|uniref:hypothetical protein n=1 Tax=Acinetobacter pittii TaxID=48296 RepID=UPI000838AD1F|nr:hypothetical protein [Acinetobacter pittii]OCY34598.1 hypothetical protein BFR75_02545 [Acinetobacter pittii]